MYYIHVRSGRSQLVHPNVMEVAEHASRRREELERRADEETRGAREHVADVMRAVAHEHAVIHRTITGWRRAAGGGAPPGPGPGPGPGRE